MSVLKKTDSPPPKTQLHFLADFVELRCTASRYEAFSAEELQDARKREESDQGEVEREASEREVFFGEDAEVPVGLDIALDITAPEDAEDLQLPPTSGAGSDVAAQDDRRELEASDVVLHLRYRAGVFGDNYPFELRDDAVLELRELTPERCLYLLLLLAANLKYVRSNADQNKLTTYFELLSPDVLRGYLGPEARVELFGTATGDAEQPRYSGSLWEKLQLLRSDLRLKLLAERGDQEIADNNHGDRGVDFVAWFPFDDDPANTLVIILGQCACGRRPWHKMLEPSEENWKPILAFPAPVVNMLLVPQCFRRPDGHWYSKARLPSGVLLDRVRMFEALRRGGSALPIAPDKLPDALLEAVLGQP